MSRVMRDHREVARPDITAPAPAEPQPEPPPAVGPRLTLLAPTGVTLPKIETVVGPRRPATGHASARRDGADRLQQAPPKEERVVEISIGRIEVRAVPGEPPPPRPSPQRQSLSLEAYLRGREARA
jgi:hypothetical protein